MKLPKIDRTIPNGISALQIPLGAGALMAALQHWRVAAMALVLVALFTVFLDGYIADKYPRMASESGKKLVQPACGLLFSVCAVAGLVMTDVWPLWVAIGLVIIAAVLQLIDAFANRNDLMRLFKRHQYYAHPLFSIATMLVTCEFYMWVATPNGSLARRVAMVGYGLSLGFVLALRTDHLRKLIAGPEEVPVG